MMSSNDVICAKHIHDIVSLMSAHQEIYNKKQFSDKDFPAKEQFYVDKIQEITGKSQQDCLDFSILYNNYIPIRNDIAIKFGLVFCFLHDQHMYQHIYNERRKDFRYVLSDFDKLLKETKEKHGLKFVFEETK